MILPVWLLNVQIERAPVSFMPTDVTARGVLWQAAPERLWLDVPEVARYFVEDGKRVVVDPAPLSTEASVMRFLRMTPLAALLYQRGSLAFHAAAIANSSGAVLLAGDSGAGKSTLLAALLQRGWMMLSDDLSPVDLDERGRPVVWPTFADIRLWPDASQHLTPTGLENLSGLLAPVAQPLRAIYWLTIHNRDAIELSELSGAERFRALGTLAYNSHIADALLDRAAYFRMASTIAQSVPIRRLRRPRGKWSVQELVEELENRSGRSHPDELQATE
jgi:hypothetical protein